MRLFKISVFAACVSLFAASSCKNELNLNAPYKEIPSVHAVLNPYEKIQMIRVNKVFLGEGDANQMAKVADSVNYKQDEITVTLKHSTNPNDIVFEDSLVTTDNGAFNTTQRVYKTSRKLETKGTYTLVIHNTHTGNIFTSVASPIADVDSVGLPFEAPYFPYPNGQQVGFIDYSTTSSAGTKTNTVYFQPVKNAGMYKLIIRTQFYNKHYGGDVSFDYVDFVVDNPKESRKIADVDYVNIRFTTADFFNGIGTALSRKTLPDVEGRRIVRMDYMVYAITQEFVDYNEFVKPSFGLNSTKPLYSNFKDNAALGIFTFRSTLIVQKQPANPFIDAFSSHPNTCKYKFFKSKINPNDPDVIIGCK